MTVCLALFPGSVFEEIAQRISRLQMFSEEVRAMRRQLFGSAFSVEFDSQGRISLPDYLMRFAFLNGGHDVVLIGDYDKVEIWAKPRFEEFDERYRVNINNEYERTLSLVAELAFKGSSHQSQPPAEEGRKDL